MWEIQIDFNHDMWWTVPRDLTDQILHQVQCGAQEVNFVWDWREFRVGSFVLNGEATSLSRYVIDFTTMMQTNIDNGRTRSVKLVNVHRMAELDQ